MEAVKLGSATVGLKNKTHAVLVALKRAASELSAYQKKLFPIDDHIGISISGLTADARMLRYISIKRSCMYVLLFYTSRLKECFSIDSRYMRTECLNYKFSHDAPLPINRLLLKLGNKMQVCTQRYDKRPYGVGLLIAGYDVR